MAAEDDDIIFDLIDDDRGAGEAAGFEVRPTGQALAGDEQHPPPAGSAESGGLATPTMGELYMRQGHYDKAARIWARILASRPGDRTALARLTECQRRLAEGGTAGEPAPVAPVAPVAPPTAPAAPGATAASSPGAAQDSGRMLATLERWLANARKLRAERGR